MEWVWELYKKSVYRALADAGRPSPADGEVERAFLDLLSESTVTVLVQEPWQNSVRFKTLARLSGPEMTPLLRDPMAYLRERFGGGKFKLNFHRGWSFVATQNFKPEGEPLWKDLPEVDS
jgi:hypothetical protein